ncbi:MAG: hypothetical protein HY078_08050 [Elusimicrobia bacterium]|nr:hypothetical protein [Elusimicrobiota bacterium]
MSANIRTSAKAGLAAVMLTAAAPSFAASPASVSKLSVEKSTSSQTAGDLYNSSGLRDPFAAPGTPSVSAAAAPVARQQPETFSIHSLYLRGIMRDKAGDYAVLVSQAGTTYILKKGRLIGPKNKPVLGVTGKTFPAQKKVLLETPDKDMQTLILGEDNKEGL